MELKSEIREQFYGFHALRTVGKCTTRHLFRYGELTCDWPEDSPLFSCTSWLKREKSPSGGNDHSGTAFSLGTSWESAYRKTWVTGDEAQGTMGRRKGGRPFYPSRLPLRANFLWDWEASGYEAVTSGKFLGALSCLDRAKIKKRILFSFSDVVAYTLLVFSVTPFKIDQNKNQNRSIDRLWNLGNERR